MDTASDALASGTTTTTSEEPTIDNLRSLSPVSSEENHHSHANTVDDAQSDIEFQSSPLEQSKRPTPKHEFKGHKNHIWSFVFLHDNVHIVSGSLDGTMRKWDCETGLLVGEPWEGQGGGIYALALSPDGKTIACGRGNGSVERWNTDGEMIEGIWMGHSQLVGSLSWSPSAGHIASGSYDGTILIRKTESGQVELGPIKTHQGSVWTVAYSPLGDRIASGGENSICIWDSHNGDLVGPIGLLLVSPIDDLGYWVKSVVWSLDGSKLYTADKFVHVFDSIKGTELLRLQHDQRPLCVALSPKHNLLACVGYKGLAQLWNTESNQPLGQPFHHDEEPNWASFSPDGRYLACGGDDGKITLWIVKDIAPEIEPQSPSPSCFEVDATKPFAGTEDQGDNVYEGFLQPSEPSYPLAAYGSSPPSERPYLLSPRRLWNTLIPARYRQPACEATELQGRPKHRFFGWRTGPRPVTVYAGRPRQFYWRAPRRVIPEEDGHTNAQATSSSATQLPSMSQMTQHPQSQPVTQPVQTEYDFGRWGNFWHAVCCIQPRPRHTVSAAGP